MWASLTLPPQADLISGSNPVYVGDLYIGEMTTLNWTVVFTDDGIFYLNVKAYGYRMDTGVYVEETGYKSVNVLDAPPNIFILSPENSTYSNSKVALSFTLDETADWIGYSLDDQANVTITGNTTLSYLTDGTHSMVVYANDTAGNMGRSDMINFTIQDVITPAVSVLSPLNKTYGVTAIPLAFTVDESVEWMVFSLDEQANVTISSNTTLPGMSEGSHNLVVYARDIAGNTGASSIVYFSFMLMHDVAVVNVSTSKTGCLPFEIVGQGFNLAVFVKVKNEGSYTEIFNVTAYSESSLFGQMEVTLTSGQSEIVTFTWDTTGFAKGNYTVSGVALPVPDEYNASDNERYAVGDVFVTIPGDLDGDKDVDIFDIVRIATAYSTTIGEPAYQPNSDVDDNGIINIFDVVIAATRYGQSW